MPRILIVRTCAIGDFVLNLPALRALQDSKPNATFTLVGNSETLELARDFIRVEAIHSIDSERWRRLFHEPASNLEYGMAIVWMKDPAVARNLEASGVPSVLRADPFPNDVHAAAHLLATLGLTDPPFPDRWNPRSRRIVLHPGSGGVRKRWPNFVRLAESLEEPVFLIGPAEEGFEVGGHRRIANMRLTEAAKFIAGSAAFVGNDAGMTHIAAYWGCPTVALFGPTDPTIWGPIGKRVHIVHKQQLESIEVEEALDALQDLQERDFLL